MTISPVESRTNMIVYLVSQVTVKRGFLAELVFSPVVKYHKVKQEALVIGKFRGLTDTILKIVKSVIQKLIRRIIFRFSQKGKK